MLGANSCTFYSGAPGPSFYAPASGTLTAVHVKTGNFAQGPMQILIMRSLYQNRAGDPGHPYFACCFVERYGPTFTPASNAVTTVPTSLPMVEDPTPPPNDTVTNARGDFIALSVLAPNVPVPANSDGSSFFSGFAPAPNPQTTPAPSPNPIYPTTNGVGYHMSMNAELDAGTGAGFGGGRGTTPPLSIASGGQLLGTTASVPLSCALTTACDGVLSLTDPPARLRAAARKAKVYGSAHYRIPTGKTRRIGVRLNADGRKKLGRRSSLTLLATTKIGSKVVSRTVTLRRPPKRR
jgi:hypothetical protein